MLAFQSGEPRQSRCGAQLLHITAVDGGEQGVHDLFEQAAAEMPLDKPRHGLILLRGRKRPEHLRRQGELVGERQQRSPRHRPEPRGNQELEPLGQSHQAPPVEQPGAAAGVERADELPTQSQALAQLERLALFGEHRVAAGLDDAAVKALGAERAAETRRGLEELVVHGNTGAAGIGQVVGGA